MNEKNKEPPRNETFISKEECSSEISIDKVSKRTTLRGICSNFLRDEFFAQGTPTGILRALHT